MGRSILVKWKLWNERLEGDGSGKFDDFGEGYAINMVGFAPWIFVNPKIYYCRQ